MLVNLYFNLMKECVEGEEIFISGNIPELGNWSPLLTPKLNTCDQKQWELDLSIMVNEVEIIEYKYLSKTYNGLCIWENGKNRKIFMKSANCTDYWNESEVLNKKFPIFQTFLLAKTEESMF